MKKISLVMIILLSIALVIITIFYWKMRNTVRETVEENNKLNARISELENKDKISSITNVTLPSYGNASTDFVNATMNEKSKETDYSVDANKIKIQVDKSMISSTSISIIIYNDNENPLSYGQEFRIQKKENDKWRNLEYNSENIIYWNAIAYLTKGKSQSTEKLDIAYYYGALDKGTYRVEKPILNGNHGNVIYSDEFVIE